MRVAPAVGKLVLALLPALLVAAGLVVTGPEARGESPPAAAYPRLLKRLPLKVETGGTPDESRIRDFRRDPVTGDLYVTDSGGQLYRVDGDTLSVTATLPVGGDLTLDAANRRLYVSRGRDYVPEEEAVGITVVDLTSFSVVGVIPEARFLSIDAGHGRLFTGTAYSVDPKANTVPVRVYDAASLKQVGELPLHGIPLYNPYRGDLIVLTLSALVVDPASGKVTGELLPDVRDSPCPNCVGSQVADLAHFFPEGNLIAIEMYPFSTAGGAGKSPEPRFFDATTLAPIAESTTRPIWRASCSSKPHLLWPIDGRWYDNDYYVRYLFYWNMTVRGLAGQEEAFRDGLYAIFINPNTQQMLVDNGYVLDLTTLLPLGRFPRFCWLDYDPASGLFFGRDGTDLLIMAERGGSPLAPPQSEPRALPEERITRILPSPTFSLDKTAFVVVNGRTLYRTDDGGESWTWLRGGLPEDEEVLLDFALSPTFAEDQTLFAGGAVRSYQGEGVLRSTDRGDSWQPVWDGLDSLRVYQVSVAPDFAASGRVAAYSEYLRISPWMSAAGLYTSTNAGPTWTLAITEEVKSDLPPPEEVWGHQTEAVPVRLAGLGEDVEVAQAGGTWRRAGLDLVENDWLKEVVASPSLRMDDTYYVLGRYSLWRTRDAGASWEQWADPRLEGRTYENDLSSLAVVRQTDASHQVWIGTNAGELWQLNPDEMAWEALEQVHREPPVPEPTPTPAPAPTSTPTPTAPPPVAAPLTGDPPAGLYRPEGALASVWQADAALQQAVGWATSAVAVPMPAAYQRFQGGTLIWRGDTSTIYVIRRDGRWRAYQDTFREGEPESDPSLVPPGGMLQPIRGFGKLWRREPTVREQVGWALAKEQGFGGFVHEFERGLILTGGDRLFVLVGDEVGDVWQP